MAKPKAIRHDAVAVLVDNYQLRRVQTANVSTDLSTEDVSELANVEFVEQVRNTPAVSVTIDTNEYAHVDTLAAFANKDFGELGNNNQVITLDDLKDSTFDITIPVKEDGTLARTMHVGNCVLDSISLSYDVGGVAAENYAISTDNKTWFLNSNKGAKVASGTFVNSTTFTSSVIDTGFVPIWCNVNNCYNVSVDSWADYTVTVSDVTLEDGDRIRLLYRPSGEGGTFPALNTTGTGIGAVRKGQVDVFLYDGGGGADTKVLRLQSVNIDVDFGREVLEELGSEFAFERTATTPIPVDVTCNFLDTDLQQFVELAGSGANFSDTDYHDLNDLITNASLVVKVHNTTDKFAKSDNTLMRMVMITGLDVTAESHDNSVGSVSSQSFTLRGSNLTVSGTGKIIL